MKLQCTRVIQVNVSAPAFLDRTLTRFYTYAPGMPKSLEVGANNEEARSSPGGGFRAHAGCEPVSRTQHSLLLHWGDTNCCLPQGATEATLQGTLSNLQVGDVLIFQEVLGPQTGFAADADIRHRCAVRLTAVTTQSASGQTWSIRCLTSTASPSLGLAATDAVTEIQWSTDDALPFPVCVSSTYLNNDTETQLNNVSLVYGNIVLADQGLSMLSVPLGTVPGPTLLYPPNTGDRCQPSAQTPFPIRYRPKVPDSSITQAVPLPLPEVRRPRARCR